MGASAATAATASVAKSVVTYGLGPPTIGYQGITACATCSTFARCVTRCLWGRAAALRKEGAACLSSHPTLSAARSGSWRSRSPGGAARSADIVGCAIGGASVGPLLLLGPLCGLCPRS